MADDFVAQANDLFSLRGNLSCLAEISDPFEDLPQFEWAINLAREQVPDTLTLALLVGDELCEKIECLLPDLLEFSQELDQIASQMDYDSFGARIPQIRCWPDHNRQWKRLAARAKRCSVSITNCPKLKCYLNHQAEADTVNEVPYDKVEAALNGIPLSLFQRMRETKHFIAFDTLANECSGWRKSPPNDRAIEGRLKAMKNSIEEFGFSVVISSAHRRARLEYLPGDSHS